VRKELSIALIFVAVAALASAQTAEDVFHFTSPQSQQNIQEALTIVRTVADVTNVSGDSSQNTITMKGPQAQVTMAHWILTQIDTPGNESAVHEYDAPAGDNVVRVNFLPNVGTAQPMQETLTVLRTVADVAKVFNFTARRAIVVRGTASQVAFCEWIMEQLNLPADQKPDATPRVYPGAPPDVRFNTVARVNYLQNVSGPKGMQQLLTVERIVGEIMKIFNYSSLQALVLRGPEPDVARAEWLIQQLDVPADSAKAGTQTYATPGADDVTRIFFLSNGNEQGMMAAVAALRSANIKKAFFVSAPSAVVVRGTADQIEAAVQVLAQRNGLARLKIPNFGNGFFVLPTAQ
jgi:type II secretory pathway component GspD/PulD (secretin)